MTRRSRYDKSRWQQERERFHLSQQHPLPPEPAGDIRQAVLDIFTHMQTEERSAWRQLEREWAKLVGPEIAKHARPVRLEQNVLVVGVDSSVWMNELIRYQQSTLLVRCQQCLGQERIKAIRFQPDARPAQPH